MMNVPFCSLTGLENQHRYWKSMVEAAGVEPMNYIKPPELPKSTSQTPHPSGE